VAQQQPPETLSASDGRNVFTIKESDTGRFHLRGFGEKYGGKNRDRPFKFRVVDQHDRLIAESCEVTAAKLRIAEKSQGHYNSNQFLQSDFFVQMGGEGPKPHSAIAKRVKWYFA
jgi:hypothetical protein